MAVPHLIHNATRGETLCADCRRVRGLASMRGLMLRRRMPGDGMLLELGRSRRVHTFGMLFTIDVVLLDRHMRVVWAGTLPPWRKSPRDREVRYALELPPGRVARTGSAPGDLLADSVQAASPPPEGRLAADLYALSRGIGSRLAGSAGERQAAAYVSGVLQGMGLAPREQVFRAPRTPATAWLVMSLATLVGLALSARPGPLSLVGVAPWTAAAYLAWRDPRIALPALPPWVTSRNVSATLPAQRGATREVVLAAHLDTAPIMMRADSPRWPQLAGAVMLGCIGAVLALPAAAPVIGMARTLAWVLGAAVAFGLLLLLPSMLRLTCAAPGASDDASGVAVLLELARRLKRRPLAGTNILLLATGAEETGLHGMKVFLRSCRPNLVIALDDLGEGTAHCIPSGRRGRFAVRMAARAGIPPAALRAAVGSDADAAAARGVPAVLVAGLLPDNKLPELHHSLADLPEYVDVPGLERVAARVEGFLRLLDREV
ncbi:MAG: M28 family peptidase [Thermaerobacter sp.]|nr:M28 family peptidase [Thermaerobacter sp.]